MSFWHGVLCLNVSVNSWILCLSIQAHSKSVNCVEFLRGKTLQLLVTGSDDATVAVWTVQRSETSVRMKYVSLFVDDIKCRSK